MGSVHNGQPRVGRLAVRGRTLRPDAVHLGGDDMRRISTSIAKRAIKDAKQILRNHKLPNDTRENLFGLINKTKWRRGWR